MGGTILFVGELVGIYVAGEKTLPLRSLSEVRAVAGRGLEGDRYFDHKGTFSQPGNPNREVTLIESEAVEAVARDAKIPFDFGQARRNLVTRGVPLNHLVGKEFRVGDVRLRGLKLCEPCDHLERLTAPKVEEAFRHRGGLRAQILEGGVLRVGDRITG